MYVKSLVLDGFKSYGTRTEITGFDTEFNAITGLNGTGKSNILDGICFLLGLSNLKDVRATQAVDLIYKQGKTGVSKASVTITFDNSDLERSPPEYVHCKEIVVTRQIIVGARKSKQLINGINVTNAKLKDMFNSVQLNVNTPHFLVMQGRITKVLNMKPIEILTLIEEASGTRHFENKKKECQQVLIRKDQKLIQIDEKIKNDIKPRLDTLRSQKAEYLEFRRVEKELEHCQRVFVAWQYYESQGRSEDGLSNLEKIINEIKSKQNKIKDSEDEINKITEHVGELQREMDSESGGCLSNTESKLSAETSKLNELMGIQKQNNESCDDERKIIKELEKNIKDDENVLKTKTINLQKIDSKYNSLVEEEETDKIELDKARQKFQALSAGFVVDEAGNEATLQDQLMAAQRALANAQLKTETIKKKKPHCESQLKIKSTELKKMENEFSHDNMRREKLEQEVEILKSQLQSCDALRDEENRLNGEASNLRRQLKSIEQRECRLSFRYQDPEVGFNRKSVHGLVCKLFEVVDDKFAHAVETVAGGSLFNVVVDTDVTGQKLIKKGKLERRITAIPLNKIKARPLTPKIVQAAQRIVGVNSVWPALSLIRYGDTHKPAMEYIFGTTLVCKDMETAKKICFHPEVRTVCVTLDGDMCNPTGVISGGAQERREPILPVVKELNVIQKKLDEKDKRLVEIERDLEKYAGNKNINGLKQKLDNLEDQILAINARLHQCDQNKEEVKILTKQIAEFNDELAEYERIINKETKTIKEVQSKNDKSSRENVLKEAENDVQKWTKKASQSRKEVLKRKDEHDSLKLELNDLNTVIATNKELIEKHKSKIEVFLREADEIKDKITTAKKSVDDFKNQLKSVKDVINRKNKDLTKATQAREKIKKDITKLELEIKQDEKDHDKLKQEVKDCKNIASQLLKEYDWISQEEQYFGKSNGVYDFNKFEPNNMGNKINNLKEKKNTLSRKINAKAMKLLDRTEEKYIELIKKREQVELDKTNINGVLRELGEKKKTILEEACIKIDGDFGSIFSSLLTDAKAKLHPFDNVSMLSGIEFKVGFGGKWKDNLGELSGGQRSLVALSFILAMLLYKPAPIYILDEVDAALDLSHTQNIGNMLKDHFKTSQFIIVSLKDGMFNNANVLFKTCLKDGMSTVTRTVQGDLSK